MKVLCISDSLGLPRDGVSYEETWFYKLTTRFPHVHFISKFQRLQTTSVLKEKDYSSYYHPDIVIMQLGICDCAPRIILQNDFKWLLLERVLNRINKNLFWKLIKKYKKRSPDVVMVTPEKFRGNVSSYFDNLINQEHVKRIIVIKIGTSGSEKLKKSSPFLRDNIEKYNHIYEEYASKSNGIVSVVDPLDSMKEEDFVEDGYHVNGKGNTKIFEELYQELKELL